MLGRLGKTLADAGRGMGGLLYWNLRKSVYARRGGRCPCQNESDDPVPGRVRCDAVLHWHAPARFRTVCPLLVETPDGWRCSVAPAQVRPFWGRAAAILGAVVLSLYLAGTLGAWAGVRLIGGTPVGWWQFAWPGRWGEVPREQSAHQFRAAMAAFREGRLDEAHLLLESARRRDPGNYEAGLLLAQIAMFQRSFLFADELFATLQAEHPTHGLRTAITYHDTLLGTDRMEALARHSLTMAGLDPAHAAVWVRSGLLAVKSMRPDAAPAVAELLEALEGRLAPHALRLLQAERDLLAGRRREALQRLRELFSGPRNPFYTAYQIERLAELGAPADAQGMLDAEGPVLGRFEQLRLQVIVATAAGDGWGRRAAFTALLKMPLSGAAAERLAALLVTHSDAGFAAEFARRVNAEPALARSLGAPVLWVAAASAGVPAHPPAGVPGIDFTRRDVVEPGTALHLINTVTLPREVILALLWRTDPKKAPRTPRDRG